MNQSREVMLAKKRESAKLYYLANKEKSLAKTKKWIAANKSKKHEYDRKAHNKMYKNSLNFRLSMCARSRLKTAIKRAATRQYEKSSNLIGCTTQQLREYLEKMFETGMTWANYGVANNEYPTWQIDHIRPCASFDLTKPSEQQACFHYTNLQPMWAIENLRKGAKY